MSHQPGSSRGAVVAVCIAALAVSAVAYSPATAGSLTLRSQSAEVVGNMPTAGESARMVARVSDPCSHLDYTSFVHSSGWRSEWSVADFVSLGPVVAKGVITESWTPRFGTLNG